MLGMSPKYASISLTSIIGCSPPWRFELWDSTIFIHCSSWMNMQARRWETHWTSASIFWIVVLPFENQGFVVPVSSAKNCLIASLTVSSKNSSERLGICDGISRAVSWSEIEDSPFSLRINLAFRNSVWEECIVVSRLNVSTTVDSTFRILFCSTTTLQTFRTKLSCFSNKSQTIPATLSSVKHIRIPWMNSHLRTDLFKDSVIRGQASDHGTPYACGWQTIQTLTLTVTKDGLNLLILLCKLFQGGLDHQVKLREVGHSSCKILDCWQLRTLEFCKWWMKRKSERFSLVLMMSHLFSLQLLLRIMSRQSEALCSNKEQAS